MSKENQPGGIKIIAENRKARFLYEILETYEAGIQLIGTEVKSIRAGRVNLQDGYAIIRKGEVWLINVNISPYEGSGAYFNHEPKRSRKLLQIGRASCRERVYTKV